MKRIKIIPLIITLLIGLGINLNNKNVAVASADSTSFYLNQGLDGKSSTDLLNGLATLLNATHTYYNTYEECKTMAAQADADLNNSGKIITFYAGDSISSAWDGGATWNREHVWPKSLSSGLYTSQSDSGRGAGADIHHIRPTYMTVNSTRNNRLFAEIDESKMSSDSSIKEVTYEGEYIKNYYDGNNHYEPRKEVKGDTARILMYLYTHYSTNVSTNNASGLSYKGALAIENVVYGGSSGSQSAWNLLMDWNDLDPVDEWEMARNNACANITGTRNPFIDHPEFARMIWDTSYNGNGALKDESTGGDNEGGNTGSGDNETGGESGDNSGSTDSGINDELIIDITAQGYTNAQDVTTISSTPILIEASKGNGSNPPKYYNADSSLRLYASNTLTFSITETDKISKIDSIVIECVSSSYTISSSSSSITNGSVSVESTSCTIVPTNGQNQIIITNNGSNQFRIRSIKVIYSLSKEDTTIPVTGVSLDKTSLELKVGESTTLNETVLPTDATNKNVTWKSSDESIVSVNEGFINAKSVGSAVITVTTVDENKSATCKVTVNPIEVTSVSLDKSNLSLNVGNNYSLSATVLPENATNKNVIWTSSVNSIATVSQDGLVTALSAGTTVITVETEDGGFTATCEVVVSVPVIEVSSITFDVTETTLNIGDTLSLNVTVLPYNATDKSISWTSSNTNCATVSDGVIYAIAKGTTTITATALDGSGKYATCKVTVISSSEEVLEGSVTLIAKELGIASGSEFTAKTIDSITFSANSNGGTSPKYYSTGEAIRIYGKNTFTISADGLDITKVEITCDTSNTISSSNCSLSTGSMSINSNVATITIDEITSIITLTNPNSSGHFRMKEITVYYSSSSGTTPEPDNPTPDDPVVSSEPVPVDENTYFQKVTDISELKVGHNYIIVAANYETGLSTTQNSNNRSETSITKLEDGKYIKNTASLQTVSLEEGNIEGTYAFNVGNGYLYAASSSNNHLRVEEKISDNSSWSVEITEGIASISASGTNTRNKLKYNSQNKIFSCYASGQQDLAIYRVSDASAWIYDWNTMRSENDGFCSHLIDNDEIINGLISRYDNLDSYSKNTIIGNNKDIEGIEFNTAIEYARTMIDLSSSNKETKINILSDINTFRNEFMVLIVGLIGITSVLTYYYLNKKKYF